MTRLRLPSEIRCIVWSVIGPGFLSATLIAAALHGKLLLLLFGLGGLCAFPICLMRGERSYLALLALLVAVYLFLFGSFAHLSPLTLFGLGSSFALSLLICRLCFEDVYLAVGEFQQRLSVVEEKRLVADRSLANGQRRFAKVEEALSSELCQLREKLEREMRLSLSYSQELHQARQGLRRGMESERQIRSARSKLNQMRPDYLQARLDLKELQGRLRMLRSALEQSECERAQVLQQMRELRTHLTCALGEREILMQLIREDERLLALLDAQGYQELQQETKADDDGSSKEEDLAGHVGALEEAVAELLQELKMRCVPHPAFSS